MGIKLKHSITQIQMSKYYNWTTYRDCQLVHFVVSEIVHIAETVAATVREGYASKLLGHGKCVLFERSLYFTICQGSGETV